MEIYSIETMRRKGRISPTRIKELQAKKESLEEQIAKFQQEWTKVRLGDDSKLVKTRKNTEFRKKMTSLKQELEDLNI